MKVRLHLVVIEPELDLRMYNLIQKLDALESELNRNGTREEFHCDDKTLEKNPSLLMMHYATGEGAKYAERVFRCKCWKEKEIPLHIYAYRQVTKLVDKLRRIPRKEIINTRRVLRRISLLGLRLTVTKPIDQIIQGAWQVVS